MKLFPLPSLNVNTVFKMRNVPYLFVELYVILVFVAVRILLLEVP